jgi:transketolase
VFTTDDKVATRAASGKVINAVAPHVTNLIGGSADLAPSNNTLIKDSADQQAATPAGRNVRWGVRELAMAAMANGLSTHGGIRPYVATFFVFVDYMRPAMRLSALMKLPVIYVLTHDSIGVGEDGPTHQPVEHLAMLRATPGFIDLRPADANETVEAWKIALQTTDAPTGLMLTRQNLPTIDREKYAAASGIARGAYVLHDNSGGGVPDVILIASGSEVALAMEAHERLVAEGVRSRLVNMASMRLFEQQDNDYKQSVLPPSCSSRVAVEAGVTFGWERYAGDGGVIIGLDHFGASAPAGTLFEQFGFTADNVYAQAKALLA